jgi:hypothetical protein
METRSKQDGVRELDARELDSATGAGIWEALLCALHGGTDASHTQTRREGGGPRGG